MGLYLFGTPILVVEVPDAENNEMPVLFRYSGEKDTILQAQVTPAMAMTNTLTHAVLPAVSERAAARLSIEWAALLNPADEERDVYDSKFLGPSLGTRNDPCARYMKLHWKDPLDFKHGLA